MKYISVVWWNECVGYLIWKPTLKPLNLPFQKAVSRTNSVQLLFFRTSSLPTTAATIITTANSSNIDTTSSMRTTTTLLCVNTV